MPNHIPGCGPSNARLMVVGEAPGAVEDQLGYPFAGPSGKMVDECLTYGGTDRNHCYLTNVVKVRPPNNKLDQLHMIGRSVEEFLPELYREIEDINPNCILAVGNTALQYVCNLTGIQKYRGSILPYPKAGCNKAVPTLHPASLLHGEGGEGMSSWRDLAFIKADVKRAVEQSMFPEYKPPERTLSIARNSQEVYRFLNRHQRNERVTLDVETTRSFAQCVGLAFNSFEAMSIPTFVQTIPMHEMVYIWRMLSEFLADTNIKIIAQNAKFDQKRCRQIGLTWHDCWFSLDMGWHVLWPEFPKKLELISSLITEEPYYKDEGKEIDFKYIDKWFKYNARDAVVEYECADKILEGLKEAGLWEFFWDKIHPLYNLYYDIEDVGILVDLEVRKHLHKKYESLRDARQLKLVSDICQGDPDMLAGWKNFNVMSNGPKNQVAKLVYGVLKCPLRKDTSDETMKSLANNSVKDQRRRDILYGILEVRKLRKTISTYIQAKTSSDHCFYDLPLPRMHTQYNINGTETGRTTTGILKPPVCPEKRGIALQTMTKHEDAQMKGAGGADLRSMFIADPGFSFVEPDQSQAEDRAVCVLAKDWEALKQYDRKIFNKNKHGLKDDRHTLTAMLVCGIPFDDVTDYERQIGKKTRHAGNYNMGKHMHMLNLGRFGGVFISEWQAGKQLDRFHEANSNIRSVFHAEVEDALRSNDCRLVNPLGRPRTFFNKWGPELFKEAYAFLPQSTISDQTKFAMVRLEKYFPREYMRDFFFVQESHDSFLSLVRDSFIPEFNARAKIEFEQPIDFNKCTLSRDYQLVIPSEIKVGKRWVSKSQEYPDGMETVEV